MENGKFSRELLVRMPRYFRVLRRCVVEGRKKISSADLSAELGITASQVRRDIGSLGLSGQNGYGYPVKELHDVLGEQLGVFGGRTAVIVGAGNLGRALASHKMFLGRGFTLIGVFDKFALPDTEKAAGLTVLPMEKLPEFCENHHPDLVLLCVDAKNAVDAATAIAACGVKGILNFTEEELPMAADFPVENVHIGDMLHVLSQRIGGNDGV